MSFQTHSYALLSISFIGSPRLSCNIYQYFIIKRAYIQANGGIICSLRAEFCAFCTAFFNGSLLNYLYK